MKASELAEALVKFPKAVPVFEVEGQWVEVTGVKYTDKRHKRVTFQLSNESVPKKWPPMKR